MAVAGKLKQQPRGANTHRFSRLVRRIYIRGSRAIVVDDQLRKPSAIHLGRRKGVMEFDVIIIGRVVQDSCFYPGVAERHEKFGKQRAVVLEAISHPSRRPKYSWPIAGGLGQARFRTRHDSVGLTRWIEPVKR
jgi:hypothetical protein